MFSALRQGSILYILEKGEKLSYKTGQVISVTYPTLNNNYIGNGSTVDINVKVGSETMDFKNAPSSQSTASYTNVFIAETKELISSEVDNILQNSRSVIDSVPYHTNLAQSCEEILTILNPRFAKEKERDEDISNLKNQIGGIESKMDKILTLLSKDGTK